MGYSKPFPRPKSIIDDLLLYKKCGDVSKFIFQQSCEKRVENLAV